MRKLKITELNRISTEEFKTVEKLPLIVVLDHVRSLYNVGSVFRSSDAFRVASVYLCGITATPPQVEIHKTALGAEDSVNWVYYERTQDAVEHLKAEGYEVWAVEQVEGSIMLQDFQPDKAKKYAIILGNERCATRSCRPVRRVYRNTSVRDETFSKCFCYGRDIGVGVCP